MIPRSHKRDFGVILEPHGSSLSIFRKYENLPPDDVSVQQMIIKNAISLCWRTMPLRGLGPKGARVGHCVGIVRQVLCRGKELCFFIGAQHKLTTNPINPYFVLVHIYNAFPA